MRVSLDTEPRVALPYYNRTTPGLLERTVRAKIGPPNFTTFQRLILAIQRCRPIVKALFC